MFLNWILNLRLFQFYSQLVFVSKSFGKCDYVSYKASLINHTACNCIHINFDHVLFEQQSKEGDVALTCWGRKGLMRTLAGVFSGTKSSRMTTLWGEIQLQKKGLSFCLKILLS